MDVELLWWPGCPSRERAEADLRTAMRDAGLDPADLRVREIADEEQAAAEGFPGSPTIRVDGADVLPPPPGQAAALSCRLYRRRDGRPSPTPDPADLRAALAGARTAPR